MRVQESKNSHQALQDYLQAIADAAGCVNGTREKQLLFSWAELRYQTGGGRKCVHCRAAVRHVLPVSATRPDGTVVEFECLCQRCLLGEIAQSNEVTLRVGDAAVSYRPERRQRLRTRPWNGNGNGAAAGK